MHFYGKGTKRNQQQGVDLLLISAELGDYKAIVTLMKVHENCMLSAPYRNYLLENVSEEAYVKYLSILQLYYYQGAARTAWPIAYMYNQGLRITKK